MRIAVLVEFFPPNLGSDRRIFEIMHRLASRYEIHFIVIPPLRLFYGTIPPTGTINRHFWKKESYLKYKKIHGHFIPIPSNIFRLWAGKIGVLAYLLTTTYLFFKVLKMLRKIDPQSIILNFPSANTGILGFTAGKILRKRVLTDFCDLIAQYTCTLLRIKGLRAKALLMIQNFIVKRSHKIIVTTEYIKRYVKRMNVPPMKIITIPNGVDLQQFNPKKYKKEKIRTNLKLPNEAKICIYFGRLDLWAGTKILQDVAIRLNDENTDVKILVVGEGEEKFKLKNNIISLGRVPYKNMPLLLSSADVALIPFPDEDYAHAASPLKLFESMAMALPIIASNVSGIQEIVKNDECGILVNPTAIDGWCESILFLLHNPQLSKRLGKCARKIVEKHHDWNVLARQYEKAFLE